jgi:hypothetical protein
MLSRINNSPLIKILLILIALGALTLLVYQIPWVKLRVDWRVEVAKTYLRGIIYPAGPVPTPAASSAQITEGSPTETPISLTATNTPTLEKGPDPVTPEPTATHLPNPTAIPGAVSLASPEWERQSPNNCGPASLAIYLRYYGWEGDQEDISSLIKPIKGDRNVNVEELVYYVRTRAGWLNTEFRVGGDIDTLKHLLAAGFPVMIEESFYFEDPYWPNDDLWAAHYLVLTGYDDDEQTFTGQDSFHGPDQKVSYETLDEDWKIFNRVYIIVYLPHQEEALKAILRDQWDVDTNRQHALELAEAEVEANPDDAFAWFNIGSNQVYFGNYGEAAQAYDQARSLGLPQRMLRYQFGPFFAYFHTGQYDELLALTEYALERTDQSEEGWLWHGWTLYRQGDINGALEDWLKALEVNPNYQDANYAIDFAKSNQ